MDIGRTVEWSEETYTVTELLDFNKMPVVAMVKQGHCSLREEDSLSQGQIIRIARLHTQKRVIARDAKGREISIPLDFPLQFEILPAKSGSLRGTFRKLKRMRLTDLVRNYQLPHKVRLPSSLRTNPIVLNLIGIDLVTGPIDLIRMDEEVYLQGNAVNFGELDTTILNIPDNSDLEVSLAVGARAGKESQFRKLENKLADKVAKDVRFGTVVGAQEIKRILHIGAQTTPARPRLQSTIGGASSYIEQSAGYNHSPTQNGDAVSGGMYQKRNSRPSLAAIEKRLNSGPFPLPNANSNAEFHFDNAAFDSADLSESDELESESDNSDAPKQETWTNIKLDGDDDDNDLPPPKELFTTVSSFSFHNPKTWGFGKRGK
ncbi:uncharacterized protein [Diadema antillarum]|uniref:uncharacterized protein n=1 Tax=Diadema antillarum TaxID=105358 RepID=UPI003A8C444B